jgi:hypothetical protein
MQRRRFRVRADTPRRSTRFSKSYGELTLPLGGSLSFACCFALLVARTDNYGLAV